MKTIEYHTRAHDKSAWGPGPWQHEPDKRQWQDPATGLPCLIVRNGVGALCGYVGAPPGHPLHGACYDDADLDAHGGLTFAGACMDTGDESIGVCHRPDLGEPEHVWWLGFDCGHYSDYSPGMAEYDLGFGDTSYRDLGYVTDEVTRLAAQVASVQP